MDGINTDKAAIQIKRRPSSSPEHIVRSRANAKSNCIASLIWRFTLVNAQLEISRYVAIFIIQATIGSKTKREELPFNLDVTGYQAYSLFRCDTEPTIL